MEASGIREKLHRYIEVADEKKIRAIYTILQNEIEAECIDTTINDAIMQYLPYLNTQQLKVVLDLVKAFVYGKRSVKNNGDP